MKYIIKQYWNSGEIWYIKDICRYYSRHEVHGLDRGSIDDCDKFSLKVFRLLKPKIKKYDKQFYSKQRNKYVIISTGDINEGSHK